MHARTSAGTWTVRVTVRPPSTRVSVRSWPTAARYSAAPTSASASASPTSSARTRSGWRSHHAARVAALTFQEVGDRLALEARPRELAGLPGVLGAVAVGVVERERADERAERAGGVEPHEAMSSTNRRCSPRTRAARRSIGRTPPR